MTEHFQIRPAELSDSAGIARVHTLSWKSAYRDLLPEDWLNALRWEDRKIWWDAILSTTGKGKVLVAANFQNEIVGFASVGPSRDDAISPQDVYELYAIYLAPEKWRLGIGSTLFLATLNEVPKSANWLSLWVLKDNIRGRSFYEDQGFQLDGATKMADIDGHQLEEVRYAIALPIEAKK